VSAIIPGLISAGLQIAVWLIQRSNLSKEKKARFFAWVKKYDEDHLNSVKLKAQYEKAVKFLNETPWEQDQNG